MTVSPTLEQAQAAGFSLGGEPSIALDLIDTVIHAHAADERDLLASGADAWWALQAGRLPEDGIPAEDAVRRLRAALRRIVEAVVDGGRPSGRDIAEVNRVAAAATSAPGLGVDADGRLGTTTHWRSRTRGGARLAAIARDGVELVADPERAPLLRRCANPTCTMVFLAENPRRLWCAPNVCGNRMRVARHQQRHRPA